MKRVLSAFLSVLLATGLVVSMAAPAGAITGGQLDSRHGNVGAVLVEIPGVGMAAVGSGTLVGPDAVLTAGHVTAYLQMLILQGVISLADVHVSFDQNPVAEGASLLGVSEINTHPQFNGFRGRSNPYDVGVLVLSNTVSITPATLAPQGFLDTLRNDGDLRHGGNVAGFTVVGYGATLQWPPPVLTYDF